jgi:hypothetical protein
VKAWQVLDHDRGSHCECPTRLLLPFTIKIFFWGHSDLLGPAFSWFGWVCRPHQVFDGLQYGSYRSPVLGDLALNSLPKCFYHDSIASRWLFTSLKNDFQCWLISNHWDVVGVPSRAIHMVYVLELYKDYLNHDNISISISLYDIIETGCLLPFLCNIKFYCDRHVGVPSDNLCTRCCDPVFCSACSQKGKVHIWVCSNDLIVE